jgi:hypothetical protein
MSDLEKKSPGALRGATGAGSPSRNGSGIYFIRKSQSQSQPIVSDWFCVIPDDGRKPVVIKASAITWALVALAGAGPEGLAVDYRNPLPGYDRFQDCVLKLKIKGIHIATVRWMGLADRYVLQASVVKGGAQ